MTVLLYYVYAKGNFNQGYCVWAVPAEQAGSMVCPFEPD